MKNINIVVLLFGQLLHVTKKFEGLLSLALHQQLPCLVIKKFTDAGVCCGVNIHPILPLITDTREEIELILDSCVRAGIKYVFGAVLRLEMISGRELEPFLNHLIWKMELTNTGKFINSQTC